MNKTSTLSIIIPVYNEEKTIETVVHKVQMITLDVVGITHSELTKEMIIVDDASSDQTSNIIKQLAKKDRRIRIITHQHNLGKGASVRSALDAVTGDFIIIQDADLEYSPNDYAALLEPLLKGTADVVFGTRMRGRTPPEFYMSLLGNKLLTLVTNLFFGSSLSDVFVGYKAFTRASLKNITLTSNGFDIEIELAAKFIKRKRRIVEVPISYHGRTWEEGKKITLLDGFAALFDVLKYKLVD